MKPLPESPSIFVRPKTRWFEAHVPKRGSAGDFDLSLTALNTTVAAMRKMFEECLAVPPSSNHPVIATMHDRDVTEKATMLYGDDLMFEWGYLCAHADKTKPHDENWTRLTAEFVRRKHNA
jgi:hypothetical protein